jgi:uncharacterized protein (DUF111 family)
MAKIAYCAPGNHVSEKLLFAALLDAGLPALEVIAWVEQLGLNIPFKIDVVLQQQESQNATTIGYQDIKTTQPVKIPLKQLLDAFQKHSKNSLEFVVFHTLVETAATFYKEELDQFIADNNFPMSNLIELVSIINGLNFLRITKFYSPALPIQAAYHPTKQDAWHTSSALALEIMRQTHCLVTPLAGGVSQVTPLAAALLSHIAVFTSPTFHIETIATGRENGSVMQLLIGQENISNPLKNNILIETNIDDMPPQILADVTVRLLEAGALDVYQTPIYMKKNRSGTRLAVVVRQKDEERLAEMILSQTSTLGLQTRLIEHKFRAEVELIDIETSYGTIPVKFKYMHEKLIQASPEFELCSTLSRRHQVSTLQVYQAALAAAFKWAEDHGFRYTLFE